MEALFDLSGIQEMADGDESFVRMMLTSFCTKSPLELSNLRGALGNKDLESVAAIAHKLKPSIDMLMIKSLMPVIREVEEQGKKGDLTDLETKVEELSAGVEQVISSLKSQYEGL